MKESNNALRTKTIGSASSFTLSLEPSQFFDQSRTCAMSDEQTLVFAVISQAIVDLSNRRERKDALAWIVDIGGGVFGFQWCCDCLAIDAARLRETSLKYWREVRRGGRAVHRIADGLQESPTKRRE